MKKFIDDLCGKDIIVGELEKLASRGPIAISSVHEDMNVKVLLNKYNAYVGMTLAGERKNCSILDAICGNY